MQRTGILIVANQWLLHDVDLARGGPTDLGYAVAEHPERRVLADAGGQLDSCLDVAVLHRQLCLAVKTARGELARGRTTVAKTYG